MMVCSETIVWLFDGSLRGPLGGPHQTERSQPLSADLGSKENIQDNRRCEERNDCWKRRKTVVHVSDSRKAYEGPVRSNIAGGAYCDREAIVTEGRLSFTWKLLAENYFGKSVWIILSVNDDNRTETTIATYTWAESDLFLRTITEKQ